MRALPDLSSLQKIEDELAGRENMLQGIVKDIEKLNQDCISLFEKNAIKNQEAKKNACL